jgi:hypothetical protein
VADPTPGPGLGLTDSLKLVRRKLWWSIVLAAVGALAGWLIGHLAYPWLRGSYHLVAGGLAGAVLGGVFPGRRLGWLGWGIVLGTGAGACLGWVFSSPKRPRELEGAIAGYLLGLAVGLIAEYAACTPKGKPTEGHSEAHGK